MPTPDGRIGSRDICTGAAVERVIADGGVTSLKISATLQSDNFSSGSAGWQINRATGSAEFQDVVVRGTLNADDITTGSLSADIIATTALNADNITTGSLDAARIATTALDADNITTGNLSADRIASTALNADNITSGYISADRIDSGTITADMISVTNLSAIAGATGVLNITGAVTLTSGGSFRTDSGGTYVAMEEGTPDRIAFYASGIGNPGRIQIVGQTMQIYTPGLGASITLFGSSPGITLSATDNVFAQTDLLYTNGRFETANGSVGAPAHSFLNSPNSGMFYGSSRVGIAVAGSEKLRADGSGGQVLGRLDVSSYVYTTGLLTAVSGSVSSPCWTWQPDPDTGIYRIADGYFAATTNGSIAMQWGPGANKFIYQLQTGTTNAMHYNSSSGQITYVSSTRRIKKNEEEFAEVGLTDLLQPKTFEMRQEGEGASELNPEGDVTNGTKRRLGLIAEDVTEVIPLAGIFMPEDPVPMNYEDRAVLAAVILDLQDVRQRMSVVEATQGGEA
jgi:hypothetical protein